MARSNRRRRGGGRPWQQSPGPDHDDNRDAFSHLRDGLRRTEHRRGAAWTVQPISAARALKIYSCPGCGRDVQTGIAHVAVWRADFVLGDEQALDGRRHWHTPCWKVA